MLCFVATSHGTCGPSQPEENEIEDSEEQSIAIREDVHEQGSKTVELARRHGFGASDSGKTGNRIYEVEQILNLITNVCFTP